MENEITVHVICHTHDDPGWLWTFDDYYQGTDHCKVSVKKILDNMVVSISNNKDRKFSYVEICYFKRWYECQPESIKEKVKEFIKEKRLEFINGGWVMHDEASVYYKHLIDNMRLGLSFLKQEFNITPKIGWFIDPFGHSSANANLLKQMNFDKLVLTRISHQERKFRIENHNLEFIYQPFEDGNKIFTHISYHHYCPRKTLRRYPCDEVINLKEDELKEVCENFYQDILEEKKGYKHNNILLYYGDDFSFTKEEVNYKNIEQIMNYVNENMKGKMKMIYSTPSQYFQSVENSNCKFDEYKNEDFFPYSDNDHCYWTGYFSSRANLKGLVKKLGIYISFTSRLIGEIYNNNDINLKNKYKYLLEEIIKILINSREKLGILQHHDAVTGTAKEKTNKDYENMAILSIEKLKYSINKLTYILGNFNVIQNLSLYEDEVNEVEDYNNNFILLNPNINENYLINYRINNSGNDNDLSYEYTIIDEANSKSIQANNICFYDKSNGFKYSSIQFDYKFNKEDLILPIKIIKTKKEIKKDYFVNLSSENKVIKLNDDLSFNYDTLEFTKNKIKFTLSHAFYTSYDGSNSKVRPENSNPDGAYIFAPCENDIQKYKSFDKSLSFIQKTNDYSSIVLRYPSSYLIIIVNNKNNDIYTESIFDPIPRESETGYNYMLLLNSNINNINKEFNQPEMFTDSQGINMLKRIKDTHTSFKYNVTEKISSNFYPINTISSIRDDNNKISIYCDRAQSAGVINKGEIQIICQRFSTKDDWKGVGEGLYENSSMNRFFPIKHKICLFNKESCNNNNDYFNNPPLLLNIVEKGEKVNSSLCNIFGENLINNNNLDVEYAVKEHKKLFIQIGNNYCEYNNDCNNLKKIENFNFKINNCTIDEYNLNGVDIISKNIGNSNLKISEQEYKLFLVNFD